MISILSLTAALIGASPPVAQVPPAPLVQGTPLAPRRGGLAQFDTDGDGRITRAEFDAGTRASFARIDTNHDGRIDAAERTASPFGGRGGAEEAEDVLVTLDAFLARAGRQFFRMDANADGVIDASERGRGRGQRRGGPRPSRPAPATDDDA